MKETYSDQAKVMKAFCDENRLRILAQLRGGEQCACSLLEHLEIGQSALSYHMKILVESGVVTSRECGKWTHYSIDESGSARALAMLCDVISPLNEEGTAVRQCGKHGCTETTRAGGQTA